MSRNEINLGVSRIDIDLHISRKKSVMIRYFLPRISAFGSGIRAISLSIFL